MRVLTMFYVALLPRDDQTSSFASFSAIKLDPRVIYKDPQNAWVLLQTIDIYNNVLH